MRPSAPQMASALFALAANISSSVYAADASAPATAPAAAPAAPAAAAPATTPAATDPAAAPAPAIAAGVPHEAPPLDSWIDETKGKTGTFFRTVVFARTIGDKPGGELKFLPIDVESFNKLSFMKVANGASADWDYKLNKAKFSTVDPFAAALTLTKADAVILAPEKGDWKLLRSVNGKRSVLFSAKPANNLSSEDLVSWLFNSLGWDGVVIDQKGDFLLVGSTTQTLSSPQIQALAVGSSMEKYSLQPSERKGAGLLSLSQAKQGVGIFDIVFLGQGITALPTGTKLIIEKKK